MEKSYEGFYGRVLRVQAVLERKMKVALPGSGDKGSARKKNESSTARE